MSHPYRTAPAREPGPRWGATRWAKFYVRHLLRFADRDRLDEVREWREYRKRLREYKREIAEWRVNAGQLVEQLTLKIPQFNLTIPELPDLRIELPNLGAIQVEKRRLPKPAPLPPTMPSRRVRE